MRWAYFESLKFLDDSVDVRKGLSNLPPEASVPSQAPSIVEDASTTKDDREYVVGDGNEASPSNAEEDGEEEITEENRELPSPPMWPIMTRKRKSYIMKGIRHYYQFPRTVSLRESFYFGEWHIERFAQISTANR